MRIWDTHRDMRLSIAFPASGMPRLVETLRPGRPP